MVVDSARFLLVEDDPHDVELIQLALESYPFARQMDVVRDGEQALNYLLPPENDLGSRTLPRMVLLDLKLPKVSGIEVLARIRQNHRTHNLIVVIMTSSAEDSDVETCYNLGVNSYVVKPLDFQQFLTMSQQIGAYWMQLNSPPRL